MSEPTDLWVERVEKKYRDRAPRLVGVANRRFVGVDRMMWSSDYPHQASSWTHSQDVVERGFKDASRDPRFKITRGYGFAL